MRSARAIVATCVALLLVACGSGGDDQRITVFAAASLTDAFADVAEAFEEGEPGVSVQLNLAGSSSLREQILQGAPADVVATANPSVMDELVDAGAVVKPEVFATNSLQIVVPAGNPGGVAALEDFADDDLLVGLCAAEVPCGEFARRVLSLAGVEPALDTNEPDVRALLTKVEAGELDAAIVYTTDVLAAGDGVEGIAIPEMQNAVATYPIAVVSETGSRETAEAFVAFVLGETGQRILREHGFGSP